MERDRKMAKKKIKFQGLFDLTSEESFVFRNKQQVCPNGHNFKISIGNMRQVRLYLNRSFKNKQLVTHSLHLPSF